MNAEAVSAAAVLPPLAFTVRVPLAPARAFRLFTEELATWWPTKTHSVGGARVATTRIEPRAGGRCYETWDDGQERDWGSVRAWEPPARLVLAWHPGSPAEKAQEVEVRFTAEGHGTRVELEHRGWEMQGEMAAKVRASYEGGWRTVLGQRYREAAEAVAAANTDAAGSSEGAP